MKLSFAYIIALAIACATHGHVASEERAENDVVLNDQEFDNEMDDQEFDNEMDDKMPTDEMAVTEAENDTESPEGAVGDRSW